MTPHQTTKKATDRKTLQINWFNWTVAALCLSSATYFFMKGDAFRGAVLMFLGVMNIGAAVNT